MKPFIFMGVADLGNDRYFLFPQAALRGLLHVRLNRRHIKPPKTQLFALLVDYLRSPADNPATLFCHTPNR